MSANRLQLASRIHFVLRRLHGQAVDVGAMLTDTTYADGVLDACEQSGSSELRRLAQQFVVSEFARKGMRMPGLASIDPVRVEMRVRRPNSRPASEAPDSRWRGGVSDFPVSELARETRERLKRETGRRRPWPLSWLGA